jgi:hypothetical protein
LLWHIFKKNLFPWKPAPARTGEVLPKATALFG